MCAQSVLPVVNPRAPIFTVRPAAPFLGLTFTSTALTSSFAEAVRAGLVASVATSVFCCWPLPWPSVRPLPMLPAASAVSGLPLSVEPLTVTLTGAPGVKPEAAIENGSLER